MLEIKDLHASVNGVEILKGIDLSVKAGQVHAIMGPNGSGKSTLAQVLAGRESYAVTQGEVLYQDKDLLALSPEERAREGIFLACQYPVEIPGVSNLYFLKAALNAVRKHRGLPELDAIDFMKLARERMRLVEMEEAETCCGFGGTFAAKFPMISTAMGEVKCASGIETGAEYMISNDSSCLMQIQGILSREGRRLKTLHIAEVLAAQ